VTDISEQSRAEAVARLPVGQVQTVRGPIDPSDLGVVLPHEHLLVDISSYFVEPDEAGREAAYAPLTIENLGQVRRNNFILRDNLTLDDRDLIAEEVRAFKAAGGGTIVELSNEGLGRDPQGLVEVSQATGVHVVMGCGYYVAVSYDSPVEDASVEDIAAGIVDDIAVGVGEEGIRAGIIGELGCSEPLEPNEIKVLEAAALAQRRTGAAINIHPSPFSDGSALEAVDILRDAGADLERVVVSHCDQWKYSLDTRRKMAEAGCYIEHDSLGFQADMEFSFGEWRDLYSDAQRLNDILRLISEGYVDRLLISQDICMKHRLRAYGGWGYDHILTNLKPPMLAKGFTEEHLHTMMVENPRRILTLVSH
jgi:phosphotriesterase-related protein